MTKQQHLDSAEIEIKHLRWTSEVIADGTQIKSLAGRSARLGDGTSRNPKNRDELIEQRTKDLYGIAGQVHGFNFEEFMSDCEQPGDAIMSS